MRSIPKTKTLILCSAAVLWPLIMFVHPWGEWFGFWNGPFWAASELLLAAFSLWLGRAWGHAAALCLGAHWFFYHGVAITDDGWPLLGGTMRLLLERALYQPIYFCGLVLAALVFAYAAVGLARGTARRPGLQ